MLVADLAQPGQEGRRSGEVAALALDGLDHDRGHIAGGHDPAQDRVAQHLELRAAVASRVLAPGADAREWRMLDHWQQGPEARPLPNLRVGQRERAHGATVEAALEGDDPRPSGVEAGELDRTLNRLRSGVAQEDTRRLGKGGDARELLAEFDVARLVEVGGRDVDQPLGLLLDGGHDRGVAVAGGDDRDARCKVEEPIAVHVDHHVAAARLGDQRVGAGEGRADRVVVTGDDGSGSRTGELGDNMRRRWPRGSRSRGGARAHGDDSGLEWRVLPAPLASRSYRISAGDVQEVAAIASPMSPGPR